MSTRAGREDPCPCGSGKKYEHCCLDANRTADLGLHRLRRIEDELISDLFRFSDEVYGQDYFLEAWEEFSLWRPLAEDVADIPEFATTFPHWFLFRFEFDPNQPRDSEVDWPPAPVALAYLERHGDRIDSAKRRFIETARRRPFSFYRILRVDPGHGLALRDVFTGAEYEVTDEEASMEARVGGLFYTAVLVMDETAILIGCAPSLMPPYEELRLLDLRDRIGNGADGRGLDEDTLCDYDIEVRSQYWDAVYGDEELEGLELEDLDDDPIVFTCLHFELSCTPAEAFSRLRPLALDVREEDLLARASYDEQGDLKMVSLPWLGRCERADEERREVRLEGEDAGPRGTRAEEAPAAAAHAEAGGRDDREGEGAAAAGMVYLGYLTIDGRELMAEVTSADRADRLRAEIDDRLGGAASFLGSEVEPFEEYLEDLSLWTDDEDEEDEEEGAGELSGVPEESFDEVADSWFGEDDEEEEAWYDEFGGEGSDDGWSDSNGEVWDEVDWDEVEWGDEDERSPEGSEEEVPPAAESEARGDEERGGSRRPAAPAAGGRARVFRVEDLFPRRDDPDRPEPRPDPGAAAPRMAELFWHRWLDEKIPALLDRTPREATATPAGRERVEVLLRSYEWAFELEPEMPMAIDVATLRRELGLL